MLYVILFEKKMNELWKTKPLAFTIDNEKEVGLRRKISQLS